MGRNRIDSIKTGFTMLELTVVLAIVAAIVVVALAGIQSAQTLARIEDRKNMANEIASEVSDYYREQGVLPSELEGTLEWNPTFVLIGSYQLELTGPLKYTDGKTDSDGTSYKYLRGFGDFVICVQQENGYWDSAGTGSASCEGDQQ